MSGRDGLFGRDPAAVAEPKAPSRPPGKKTFRAFAPDQMLLLPPSLDEWLPENHLTRFVADLVDQELDLTPILPDGADSGVVRCLSRNDHGAASRRVALRGPQSRGEFVR